MDLAEAVWERQSDTVDTRSIDFVVEQLRRCRDLGRKATLVAGPGCSRTAGIPDARGFADLVRERFPSAGAPARASVADCLASIGPGHARLLVEDVVAKARVNSAHEAIAELVASGFVDRVLTPNFDDLVLRACAAKGIFPAVYDATVAGSGLELPEPAPSPSIVHLAGQRSGLAFLDHEDAIRLHSERLRPILEQEARRGRPLLGVGASGEAGDPLLAALSSAGVFEYHLFFVGDGETPLDAEVAARLFERRTRAVAVTGFSGADAFLTALAGALCGAAKAPEPPRETNGHAHLAPPAAEPKGKNGTNGHSAAVHSARSLLERVARETAEIAELEVPAAPEPTPEAEEPAADPARIDALLERAMALGYQARDAAGNGGAAHADGLFAEADALFDEAARAEGETGAIALDRWGAVLLERAKARPAADERDRLFDRAKEKCSAANALRRGRGAYNLACIAALRGRSGEARDWLEVGAESGGLPERRHLAVDTDLDAVRGEPWFAFVLSRASG